MGPISQGAINDLAGMAKLVSLLASPGGLAEAIEDLKNQMNAIVAKGAEVSEREAAIKSKMDQANKLEAEMAQALVVAKADKLEAADLKKKAQSAESQAKALIASLELAKANFEAEKAQKISELEGQLSLAKSKAEQAKKDAELASSLRAELESKKEQIKQLAI